MSFHGDRARLENRITVLIEKAKVLEDDELKSEIAKYICILSAGYIDIACRDIVYKYTEKQSSASVLAYVKSSIQKVTNMRGDKLCQLFEIFRKDNCRMKDIVDDEYLAAANSIVGIRHGLAHGSSSSNITISRIENYYARTKKLMSQIELNYLK